ncbi:ParB/RepB/Spo0J family partition protein [Candidatus Poribacteria bacterium]|nr:ParB/RepB/Spo0J family partition protein [Candidatus Poribacteria bacterium]
MAISEKIYDINLKDIKISKDNVRLTDKEVGIDELAESIEKHGLLQPIVLSGSYGSPPYELIVGQRRFLAHKKLNRNSIRAVFCGKLPDIESKILSLAENMHRVELNHADKVEAITALYLNYNKDDRRVAQELGLPLRTIRDYIKIEEQATSKAKELLRKGNVKKADVKRVIDAAQGDADKADRLLDKMAKLSKYEKARAVNYGKSHPESSDDEIIEEAKKPRMEFTVILNLPKELDNALNKAADQLSMERESVAVTALSEWLEDNGFLRRKVVG